LLIPDKAGYGPRSGREEREGATMRRVVIFLCTPDYQLYDICCPSMGPGPGVGEAVRGCATLFVRARLSTLCQ